MVEELFPLRQDGTVRARAQEENQTTLLRVASEFRDRQVRHGQGLPSRDTDIGTIVDVCPVSDLRGN